MSRIIRTDRFGMSAQYERAAKAKARLRYLAGLRPSEAAPLTDEDFLIFRRCAVRDPEQFGIYIGAAYGDYFTFYVRAYQRARNEALESMI